MRVALFLALSALLLFPVAANAEGPHSLDIQAKRPLPTGKYAVDLASDSELGRDLRRMVMEKLAARGHQVGFSGGHVMKLQVDVTRNFQGTLTPESVLTPPRSQLPERSDARPPLPERRMRDLEPRPNAAPETLRITLTLRAAGSGEVIWVAYAACPFGGGRVLGAGRNMIDAIFANPNRSRRGEADCPI
jgi:hypothetical protein